EHPRAQSWPGQVLPAHAELDRDGDVTRPGRGPRELSAGRWLRRRAEGVAAVHERTGSHPRAHVSPLGKRFSNESLSLLPESDLNVGLVRVLVRLRNLRALEEATRVSYELRRGGQVRDRLRGLVRRS